MYLIVKRLEKILKAGMIKLRKVIIQLLFLWWIICLIHAISIEILQYVKVKDDSASSERLIPWDRGHHYLQRQVFLFLGSTIKRWVSWPSLFDTRWDIYFDDSGFRSLYGGAFGLNRFLVLVDFLGNDNKIKLFGNNFVACFANFFDLCLLIFVSTKYSDKCG